MIKSCAMVQDRGENRLPDMTIQPRHYVPPQSDEPDYRQRFNLGPDDAIYVRIRRHLGKVSDFAVGQIHRVDDEWVEVARIDCCWGYTHRHQYGQSAPGEDMLNHEPIKVIPIDSGWETVHDEYDRSYEMIHGSWQESLEVWRNG